jgi:uncharacterized membrane protein YdfJ with MMPL/SSD domain
VLTVVAKTQRREVIVGLAAMLLLFLMTGSAVVAVKAVIMNVLCVGATFGVLVWVFRNRPWAPAPPRYLQRRYGWDETPTVDAQPMVQHRARSI